MPKLFSVAALILLSATVFADHHEAALNDDEQRIVAWIDKQQDAMAAMIEQHVNINSGTMNHAGVRRVGELLAAEFDAIGFETRWVELPAEVNRAGHLVVEHNGSKGPKLLGIGHLDTVFETDDTFAAFSRDGDFARGPGIQDMKSGNIVMLFALKALYENGLLNDAQFVAVFTGDEEKPGSPLAVTREALIEAGQWADIALGFEAGVDEQTEDGVIEYATIARRSSSGWLLEVEGRQAHSSGIFNDTVGAGAIFEASRILNGFYDEVRGEQYLTFNVGAMLGGTEVSYDPAQNRGDTFGKTNVVAKTAIAHGGIRTISDEQLERTREAMRAVVARHLPVTNARITFSEGYPSMPPTEGNRQLQTTLSQINVDLGGNEMPPLDPARRGAADISFVAPYTDALAGLGAYGSGGHSPRERLDMRSLPIATKRAALLIYRLINTP